MHDQKKFQPDEALLFRPLPVELRAIKEMERQFERLTQQGYREQEALYFAYVATHTNRYGVATSAGATEFYRRMKEYLRIAMNIVEDVIKDYLHPFAESLQAHNSVANCLDPVRMFKMATSFPGAKADYLQRRLYFESQRQLGIGFQLFAVESADEEATVADDLASVDALTFERLFTHGQSIGLWIVAQLDPQEALQCKHIDIFTSKEEMKRFVDQLDLPQYLLKIYEKLPCRVAIAGDRRYIVLAINRRKRLDSTLLKLERDGKVGDRRGWKYVVVAVQNISDKMHLATREDAEAFQLHTREVLWQEPLVPGEPVNKLNPFRHPGYWDVKLTGRFLRHNQHNGRLIAGPVEQLITTLADHINTEVSTSSLNHEQYRAWQVISILGPLWFPSTRGFGINWKSPEIFSRLGVELPKQFQAAA